ncbi:DUF2185 domain-containing protein [Neisseria polysaccharea]|uniref:DUF2185 domain-containing protein n=1 Tax=Neisseria polysaccharea TaxID=489 RepID=UPI000D304721
MSQCGSDVSNIFDYDAFPEDDLLVKDTPVGWYAIVSHKIVEEGLPIKFMYREHQGDLPFDSGWRVFSGAEDDEYSNNPDNFSFHSLTRLTHYQADVGELFWADIGSVFEKKEGEDCFSPVTDWSPLDFEE